MKNLFALLLAGILIQCQPKDTKTPAAVPPDFIPELWYKNNLIYNLDVEVFQDSDGDGTGDFNGLTQQLGYLKNLGVDVIWLAPFQPTPNGDDGYDVADFYGIDPHLGTRTDFGAFMQQANKLGIRVIMDLVINHTSDQHPWFKQATQNPKSPYHNWYVWRNQRPDDWNKGMVFPGVQTETWTYNKLAKAYYFHRFYNFQPDLNAQNPAVQAEVRKIMGYWLDTGMAGFRIDAVPFYIEVPETGDEPTHQFELITQIHQFTQWRKGNSMVVGEANVDPKDQKDYFGEGGSGMQMMFNFFVNQHLFYALATGKLEPFTKSLTATRGIPPTAQWANFLRTHDEIDLGRLTDSQRDEVYARFGPDTTMQLYKRGIRRRLAPMLGNRKLIELANSLLFSLPGAPTLRYGDEIGMGDDLTLKERLSVRTPMQWTTAPNGGFSTATKPVRPVISTGPYGYQQINVATELRDSTSLLNWTRRMVGLRKQCPEIGWGDWNLLDAGSPQVLAMRYDWQGRSLVIVHNFSQTPQPVRLTVKAKAGQVLHSLLDGQTLKPGTDSTVALTLPGYGYQWYRVRLPHPRPLFLKKGEGRRQRHNRFSTVCLVK